MKEKKAASGNPIWSTLIEFARVESTDPTIKRKGELLALFLALSLGILIYTIINNTLYLVSHPGREYTIYLIQDILLFGLFYAFWVFNKKGYVYQVAYISLTLTVLIAVFASDAKYIEYSMVIFALPIGISSFVIRPHVSFYIAFLTTAAYVILSLLSNYIWEYNLTAIFALFALAFMTWVIANQLENTIQKNDKLVEDIQDTYDELKNAYETTLEGWSRALEIRDRETQGHSQRVTELTLRLARHLGFSEDDLVHVYRGVLLHDIGKLGIPDDILHKPGPLTEQEMRIMRLHPQIAVDMLSPIEYLKPALNIPRYHHEKWNGTGYPHGLSGEDIPFEARIYAVVDVFDALTHDRPYRKAMTRQEALNYVKSESGKHFDPEVVKAFLRELGQDEN